LGLFAVNQIPAKTLLGVSHINSSWLQFTSTDISFTIEENEIGLYVEGNHEQTKIVNKKTNLSIDNVFPNGMIRTPLGGFINHSESENCSLVYLNGGLWGIITNEEILPRTELTLNYAYSPCGVIKQ